MKRMSARPATASSISPAILYRSIEPWHHPTLLIDEADSFLKNNEELRGILNSGHTRDSAFVMRCVGDDHIPKRFDTWGAKAIAGIGSLADTLMDRAIVLPLRRKLPHEKTDRLRQRTEPELFDTLQAKLARFADDCKEQVGSARPPLPEELNDRAQDNWEPLLAIAQIAGDGWLEIATASALKLSGDSDTSQNTGTELLTDIRKALGDEKEAISCKDLVEILCSDDERPWATYYKGRPIQARGVANILRRYGIQSNTIRTGGDVFKGYRREQFNDVFSRYLPAPPYFKVTELQTAPTNDLQHFSKVTKDEMLLKKNQCKPLIDANCNVVTLEIPPAGEKNKNTHEDDPDFPREEEDENNTSDLRDVLI
jgi:putative DNA primase/helicase